MLYAFDLFYDLYLDQIEMGRLDADEKDIPQLIIENNLHGVDLDDRAVQLAQLGLLIKAKRKNRAAHITQLGEGVELQPEQERRLRNGVGHLPGNRLQGVCKVLIIGAETAALILISLKLGVQADSGLELGIASGAGKLYGINAGLLIEV